MRINETFRNLVIKAIDKRPYAQFCMESSVPPQALNMILYGKGKMWFSREMVKKIAANSNGKVFLNELLGAAEMPLSDPIADSPEKYTGQIMTEFFGAMAETTGMKPNINSVTAYLQQASNICCADFGESLSFEREKTIRIDQNGAIKGGTFGIAHYIDLYVASFANDGMVAQFPFAVLYSAPLAGEGLCIDGFDARPQTLILYGSDYAISYAAQNPQYMEQSPNAICTIRTKKLYYKQMQAKLTDMMIEQMKGYKTPNDYIASLLKKMDDTKPKGPFTYDGFGFTMPKNNEEKLKEFILAHADILQTEKGDEKVRIEALRNGAKPADAFKGYEGLAEVKDRCFFHGENAEVYLAVASIIYRETGLRLSYFDGNGKISEDDSELPGLIFEQDFAWNMNTSERSVSKETLHGYMGHYSEELGGNGYEWLSYTCRE